MKRVLLLFLLLAFTCTASATDYYMSTTGSDSNTGLSIPLAWANLSHAQTLLSTGDTLLIVDGTYYNDIFKAQVNGTAVAPITIEAYNGTPTFVESGTDRTLRCFNFHDTNVAGAATHPIEHYVVDGLSFENYERAIDICYGSSQFAVSNITTDQCQSPIFIGDNCFDIDTRDMVLNGSHWNAWYIWHDNYNITATDVYVTNQVEHAFFDLHTNNDNITLTNCRADTSSDDAPGVYLGHGDWGTDDDVTINNFTFIDVPLDRAIDAWLVGSNLTIDGLHSTGSMGLNFGAGSNLTMKNAYVRQCDGAADHGICVSNTLDGIWFENVTIENIAYQGIKYEFGWDDVKNVTMRDWYGDDMNYQIWIGAGVASGYHTLEYDDGTVFAGTVGHANVQYYPTKSNITLINYTAPLITYYNITLRPTNAYLKNVTVTHESDAADDRTNVTVNSSVTTNPTWINATMQNASHMYNVTVDGVYVAQVTSDSCGVVRYQYTSSWSEHDFEFDWVSPCNYNYIYTGTNEYINFNNWTEDRTFLQIANNESNDVCYSYYNSTSGLWEAFYVGYTYNNDAIVHKNFSVLGFFDSATTIAATPNTGGVTIHNATWFYSYLPGGTAKNLTEIEASMNTDGLDVWSLCGWNNATQSYTTTGSYSVDPNEGISVYCNVTGEWTP